MNVAEDFAELSQAWQNEPDVHETLAAIAEQAKQNLGCHYAGIHSVEARKIHTAVASDPVIERADKLQNELGEGPCLQAVWDREVFLVHDTATDQRWPEFGPHAAEMGLHSMLSVRLFAGAQTLGALNLYSRDVREFGEEDITMAEVFAQHASVAFANARKEEGLRRAIDARHLIGQAQGILMERYNIDEEKAFAVLRRYSQHGNVKLRAVAEQLIETRSLPGEPKRRDVG